MTVRHLELDSKVKFVEKMYIFVPDSSRKHGQKHISDAPVHTSKKVHGWIFNHVVQGSFRCGVFMFSSSLSWFPPDTLVSFLSLERLNCPQVLICTLQWTGDLFHTRTWMLIKTSGAVIIPPDGFRLNPHQQSKVLAHYRHLILHLFNKLKILVFVKYWKVVE